jgi:TonB family protein
MDNEMQQGFGGVGSVEVLFAWRDATGNRAVIDAELVEPARCPALWVGAHAGQRFMLPAEIAAGLGEGERFRLVGVEDGRFVLRVPQGAEVVATLRGELVEPALGLDGARVLPLTSEHVAEVRLGDFSFYVRPGAAPEKAADRGPILDWRAARWGLLAFAAHAAVVGSFFLAPPNASALNMDLDPSAQRYVQVQLAAIAQEREQRQLVQPGGTAGGGATAPDEAAGAGNETPEVHVAGGPGRRGGAAHRGEPTQIDARSVAAMGTFTTLAGMIADMSGDSSLVYGNPDMIDGPGGPGYQHLVGGPGIGGWGGLDMRDGGRGTCLGASCGQGTVASGPLGTSGDVGPGGVGIGTEGPMRRTARVPGGLRPGPVETTGGLSREDIRRTVRRHLNEVRFCYEQQLMSRPDLEGRVAVQFLVNADGSVLTSSVVDQSGPVGDVGSCVSQSVRRWTFPASQGPTRVTYPFVLQSAE